MSNGERETVFLERGDIHFFYRPRVDEPDPQGPEEIQRLFVLLRPRDRDVDRRLIIGRKRLPEESEHERFWGFVDEASSSLEEVVEVLDRDRYETETLGTRVRREVRPAGEGVYGLVDHVDHTHLVYRLEFPDDLGEVQEDLGIDPEASYVMAVKNPDAKSPPGVGLAPSERPDLPRGLSERFGSLRWTPAEPDLLDVDHVEFVLIGASEDPREDLDIDIDIDTDETRLDVAEVLEHLDEAEPSTEPLTEGRWR